jgi:hypothetical protein
MPFTWSNQPQDQERHLPVPPAEAFAALQQGVTAKFKLKEADEFTKTVTFKSGASAFTWGENFSAQIVPAEGGSSLRITGMGKISGQVHEQQRIRKLVERLFTDVVNVLREESSAAAPTGS